MHFLYQNSLHGIVGTHPGSMKLQLVNVDGDVVSELTPDDAVLEMFPVTDYIILHVSCFAALYFRLCTAFQPKLDKSEYHFPSRFLASSANDHQLVALRRDDAGHRTKLSVSSWCCTLDISQPLSKQVLTKDDRQVRVSGVPRVIECGHGTELVKSPAVGEKPRWKNYSLLHSFGGKVVRGQFRKMKKKCHRF